MTASAILQLINLLFAGLLAGEELVICIGVRAPLAGLEQRPHLELRQALIRRLRIVVPSLFVPALLSGATVTLLNDVGRGLRGAGVAALLLFISVTLLGTVPINQAALGWNAAAPPEGWRAAIEKWERLDTVRCIAAVAAFVLFLLA